MKKIQDNLSAILVSVASIVISGMLFWNFSTVQELDKRVDQLVSTEDLHMILDNEFKQNNTVLLKELEIMLLNHKLEK